MFPTDVVSEKTFLQKTLPPRLAAHDVIRLPVAIKLSTSLSSSSLDQGMQIFMVLVAAVS
jgi:hypothetical protein